MHAVVLAVGFVAGVVYILRPVGTESHRTWPRWEDPRARLDALLAERQSAIDALVDLDLEYNTGKLSQTDYVTLRRSLQAMVLDVENRIGAVEASSQVDALSRCDSPCPACGAGMGADDRYCSSCGRARSEPAQASPWVDGYAGAGRWA